METSNPMETANTNTCVACNTRSTPGQKYCVKCGEGLWYPCPECESSNAVNSVFCGACGFNLESVFSGGEEFCQTAIKSAKAKAAEHDLAGAIRILLSSVASPKIRLKSQKDLLNNLVNEYREQRAEIKDDVNQRLEKAKHLYEKLEFQSSLNVLNGLSTEFRTPEVEQLLDKVKMEIEKSKQLSQEIEELIKKKDLLNALPRLHSLAKIRPHDEKLQNLTDDVLARIVRTVEKYKQQGRFSEAFLIIKRIRGGVEAAEIGQIEEEVEEIVWLDNYVKKSLTVDHGLVAGIKYLAGKCGKTEYKKLLAEASRRQGSVLASPQKQTGWTAGPKQPALGIPVAPVVTSGLISGFDAISDGGYSQSSFQVAAGLAMQGLGRAMITTNLLNQKKSFFGFGRSKKPLVAWGVDFGMSSLKAVRLSEHGQQGMKVEAVQRIAYRNSDPMESSPVRRSNMLEALLNLKSTHDIKKDEMVVASLSPSFVLGRYISLPESDAKNFQSALEFEVKNQIPLPLADITWDSFVFPHSDGNRKFVMVLAAKCRDTELINEMFCANGMRLSTLQSESVALYNYQSLAAQKAGSTCCNAFLDIGSSSSTMTVVNPRRIWFRSFGIGTSNFSKSIARQLCLTTDGANEVLLDLRKAEAKISKALMSLSRPYSELVTEVARSLKGFENDSREPVPERLYLMGGGANLHGLKTFLTHDLPSLSV